MKRLFQIYLGALLLLCLNNAKAQQPEPSKMFRIYEDNDFLDLGGSGTDRSYSNGTRFDYFYEKQKSRGFLNRIMPKAGDGSKNIYGWGIMQIMVTPEDISATEYQPNDYYYAGALFVTHSLYSYNPKKKISFQTELLAGVRGPGSLAEPTQKAVHKLIAYQEPKGWHNQLKTQPLVNISVGVEKNLVSKSGIVEVNGGAQLRVGSFNNSLSVYPMLRIGKMAPYFNGYLEQHGSYLKNGKRVKTQYYLVFKPSFSVIAYDAMLRGTRDNKDSDDITIELHNHIVDLQFGAVIAHGNFALSYLQTTTSAYSEGLYKHHYGNLSLHFRW